MSKIDQICLRACVRVSFIVLLFERSSLWIVLLRASFTRWGLDNPCKGQRGSSNLGGYGVSPADIQLQSESLAWPEYLNGQPAYDRLRFFSPAAPDGRLLIPRTKGEDYGKYTLWRTAPLLCDGKIALLGETSKMISVSMQRIINLEVSCSAISQSNHSYAAKLSMTLVGAPQEKVTIAYAADADSFVSEGNVIYDTHGATKMTVREVTRILAADGKASLELTVTQKAQSPPCDNLLQG